MPIRQEILTWNDIDQLIDHLIPQFDVEFDAMLVVTRGGIIPGGLLAETLDVMTILIAAVDFPAELNLERQKEKSRFFAWPQFLQFPEDSLLNDNHILIVDDVWGSGRNMTAIKNRVSGAGGIPYTCVLHFNPYRNLFGTVRPNFYAATTDAYIVYPWEINRGQDAILLGNIKPPL